MVMMMMKMEIKVMTMMEIIGDDSGSANVGW